MLHRAARFLRVVVKDGKFDALDQLTDRPAPDETLYAYEISAPPSHCHIRAGGGRSGFYAMASYHLFPDQPTDAQMRDERLWDKWCRQANGEQ